MFNKAQMSYFDSYSLALSSTCIAICFLNNNSQITEGKKSIEEDSLHSMVIVSASYIHVHVSNANPTNAYYNIVIQQL